MPLPLVLATACAFDAHVTWLVRPDVEVSVYVPVAVNCSLLPYVREVLEAPIVIEESTIPVPLSPID